MATGDANGAPLRVIHDAVPASNSGRIEDDSDQTSLIQRGVIGETEAQYLLAIIQRHYGRWIGWDETTSSTKHPRNVNDPLLLCVCCLLAGRHASSSEARARSEMLFTEAKTLLGSALLQAEQPFSFFQAALILSLWSTTAGQRLLSLDAWSISGFALQQILVSDVFRGEAVAETSNITVPQATRVRNHLALAHLHACISLRRRAMLGAADIEQARLSVPKQSRDNFEIRMLAELHLYWTIYECSIGSPVHLSQAQSALQAWKTEWSSLFEQARHQFLQMGFDFAQLLLYERSLNAKSANIRQSLVSEMLRLSADILKGAMVSTDNRTEHLTDHVYHVITFAAITMCRLLYKYEDLPLSSHSVQDRHALIRRTIEWLGSIGLDSHVARTMGDTISAVHRRLYPEQHPIAFSTPRPDNGDFTTGVMPDFLGLDAAIEWDSLLPDWQSLTSDNATQSHSHGTF